MLHQPDSGAEVVLQQVELNTISAAFPSLASVTTAMHQYVTNRALSCDTTVIE